MFVIIYERVTSSNFLQIKVNALKMALVAPVTVTIRSGQEPSDMLILAPDCNNNQKTTVTYCETFITECFQQST